ncbi:MAG: sulfatase-like hydrolase/transferase [Candidatus Brocadiia bacterium]
MSQPDILFVFSDQHNAHYCGFDGHEVVNTPNLDRIAARGTVFDAAYTACPLCVPGRSAMLTGQLPSHTGIYTNGGIIPSGQATFLHSLSGRGYETVLCGRMHFKGPDQRHGFTKRIMGDITMLGNGRFGEWKKTLGVYGQGSIRLGMGGCVDIMGGGNSPVLEYDRAVIEAALRYLEQEHEKPQCIVVGTYGPHFPYVAPPELYRRYCDQVGVPGSWRDEGDTDHPMTEQKKQRTRTDPETGEKVPVTEDDVLAARAAYFGTITQLDRQIGEIRDMWGSYLERNGRAGIFIYSSDHGDTCGEHGIFGKQTFFEGSAAIPLVFEGAGVPENREVSSPASIMDIGLTLCDITDATPPPAQNGTSLSPCFRDNDAQKDRHVLSEWIQSRGDQLAPGRMVRRGRWKYVSFAHSDCNGLLFDVIADPEEVCDVSEEHPDLVEELTVLLKENWDVSHIVQRHKERNEQRSVIGHAPSNPLIPWDEQWTVPECARNLPEVR